ncbi:hypothetical protein [Luteipulveratus mongoliensis]|uniref:Uncharacterized protein n=1 Tax=Luteipulveratus mongoliensis TaxID=571913 RepID=A0A0K1JGU8_9MICO|nr:hypothetical protein [Luteipulveratus mongoliensis]AKU15810.1 hypothetical protein VV02_07990 [Luteipulveratus mongoliensis]
MATDTVSSDGLGERDPSRAAFVRRVDRNAHRSVRELLDDLRAEFALCDTIVARCTGLEADSLHRARATSGLTLDQRHDLVELFALCQTVEDLLGVSVEGWLEAPAPIGDLLDRLAHDCTPVPAALAA